METPNWQQLKDRTSSNLNDVLSTIVKYLDHRGDKYEGNNARLWIAQINGYENEIKKGLISRGSVSTDLARINLGTQDMIDRLSKNYPSSGSSHTSKEIPKEQTLEELNKGLIKTLQKIGGIGTLHEKIQCLREDIRTYKEERDDASINGDMFWEENNEERLRKLKKECLSFIEDIDNKLKVEKLKEKRRIVSDSFRLLQYPNEVSKEDLSKASLAMRDMSEVAKRIVEDFPQIEDFLNLDPHWIVNKSIELKEDLLSIIETLKNS